jgi:ATP-dependent exoDNAse (exonuclease V) beta subunit
VDVAARRQFSFSQLTGELLPVEAFAAELDEETRDSKTFYDAIGFGSLVHDVLARVEFAGKFDVAGWCRHLAMQHIGIDHEAAADQAREMIEQFIASPRSKLVAGSRALHREVEFLLAWPPDRIDGHAHYLRGFIDLLYQDADGAWHLIDYKTNRTPAKNVSTLARRYELQLCMYALAVERVLGQPPAELVMYFLQPGVEYPICWNDEARSRTIEQLTNSIAIATRLSHL